MNNFRLFVIVVCLCCFQKSIAQIIYLKPQRVFDGEVLHENWGVLINGNIIQSIDNQSIIESYLPKNSKTIVLNGQTILPGLIEGHSHLLLHPYNETPWDDQVLKEPRSLRVTRATVHAKNTLLAGFTSVRDLGTEGADYDDVGLKMAINQGVIIGPRMLIATRAIIATGSYAPKNFSPDIDVPQGAEEADGQNLITLVRKQMSKGADVVKVYADYRWGKNGEAMPTFSVDELKLIVETAKSAGRPTVAHSSTAEGMRRCILAGIETIEHGDNGTLEIWEMMVEKNVCLCPTLSAGDAIAQYKGWKKGIEPDPERVKIKKESFKNALQTGVKICFGGDVGVFPHGDNARELEMMVMYGMKPIDALKSATSINAEAFHIADKVGRIKIGLLADIISVEGNPTETISAIRNIKMVMKDGVIY